MATSASPPPPNKVPNYDEDVDFDALAVQDADFAKLYNAVNGKVDFQDPKALQQLTKSLLKRDFGLSLELPDDRLCPPVPVRYNYVRWVQDLIDTTSTSKSDDYDPDRKITGLDIGVGSSCIYPLLATSRPKWTMYGTDIDPKNLTYAQTNIDNNNLSSRIHIRRSTTDSLLLPLSALGVDRLDFTMCNPPFYTSKEDLEASYANKDNPPSAICTGAEVEMICEGGDVGFVLQMVEESLQLKTKVQWYTSMFGKLTSAYNVVDKLKEIGVTNWAISCLRAGNKTRRWAVAWSFGDRRPRYDVARNGDLPAALHPLPTAQTIFTPGLSRDESAAALGRLLSPLNMTWEWDAESFAGHGSAKENVWSRSARRKQKWLETHAQENGKGDEDDDMEGKKEEEAVALAFRVQVRGGEVEVRWVRGEEYVVFESFCGMLKRGMRTKGT